MRNDHFFIAPKNVFLEEDGPTSLLVYICMFFLFREIKETLQSIRLETPVEIGET